RAMARRAPRVSPAPADRSPSVTPAVPEAVAPAPGAPDVDQERLRSLPPDWLPLALIVGDAVICAVSVLLAYWLRYGKGGQVLPFGPYLAAVPVVIVFYLFALAVQRQYSSWRGTSLAEQLLRLYSGIGLAAILILAAIELGNLGQRYSRLTFIQAVLLPAVLMTAERYLLRQYETRLRRRGVGTERVLMVGTGPGSELLIRRMNMFPQYGFHVIGVAADELGAGRSLAGVPAVGRGGDLPALAETLRVDQVFLALPTGQRERLLHLIKLCEDLQLEFKDRKSVV